MNCETEMSEIVKSFEIFEGIRGRMDCPEEKTRAAFPGQEMALKMIRRMNQWKTKSF